MVLLVFWSPWLGILNIICVNLLSSYVPSFEKHPYLVCISKYLFIWKAGSKDGRDKKRYFICCFTPQMVTKAKAMPGWDHKPRISSRSLSGLARTQTFGSSAAVFPGTSVRSLMRIRVARTPVGAHFQCWCCRQWLNPLYHSPGPYSILNWIIYSFTTLFISLDNLLVNSLLDV